VENLCPLLATAACGRLRPATPCSGDSRRGWFCVWCALRWRRAIGTEFGRTRRTRRRRGRTSYTSSGTKSCWWGAATCATRTFKVTILPPCPSGAPESRPHREGSSRRRGVFVLSTTHQGSRLRRALEQRGHRKVATARAGARNPAGHARALLVRGARVARTVSLEFRVGELGIRISSIEGLGFMV